MASCWFVSFRRSYYFFSGLPGSFRRRQSRTSLMFDVHSLNNLSFNAQPSCFRAGGDVFAAEVQVSPICVGPDLESGPEFCFFRANHYLSILGLKFYENPPSSQISSALARLARGVCCLC